MLLLKSLTKRQLKNVSVLIKRQKLLKSGVVEKQLNGRQRMIADMLNESVLRETLKSIETGTLTINVMGQGLLPGLQPLLLVLQPLAALPHDLLVLGMPTLIASTVIPASLLQLPNHSVALP
jgi:hypothetical protein